MQHEGIGVVLPLKLLWNVLVHVVPSRGRIEDDLSERKGILEERRARGEEERRARVRGEGGEIVGTKKGIIIIYITSLTHVEQ